METDALFPVDGDDENVIKNVGFSLCVVEQRRWP